MSSAKRRKASSPFFKIRPAEAKVVVFRNTDGSSLQSTFSCKLLPLSSHLDGAADDRVEAPETEPPRYAKRVLSDLQGLDVLRLRWKH